ncbi:uncharacterized protein LOC143460648 [Clavelina lepadiformis]|uniref:uncharacterized protein LOC143460648 n=1 Tax=Clavelina lepadiformis TaxID=159417 RepID=UPI004040F581
MENRKPSKKQCNVDRNGLDHYGKQINMLLSSTFDFDWCEGRHNGLFAKKRQTNLLPEISFKDNKSDTSVKSYYDCVSFHAPLLLSDILDSNLNIFSKPWLNFEPNTNDESLCLYGCKGLDLSRRKNLSAALQPTDSKTYISKREKPSFVRHAMKSDASVYQKLSNTTSHVNHCAQKLSVTDFRLKNIGKDKERSCFGYLNCDHNKNMHNSGEHLDKTNNHAANILATENKTCVCPSLYHARVKVKGDHMQSDNALILPVQRVKNKRNASKNSVCHNTWSQLQESSRKLPFSFEPLILSEVCPTWDDASKPKQELKQISLTDLYPDEENLDEHIEHSVISITRDDLQSISLLDDITNLYPDRVVCEHESGNASTATEKFEDHSNLYRLPLKDCFRNIISKNHKEEVNPPEKVIEIIETSQPVQDFDLTNSPVTALGRSMNLLSLHKVLLHSNEYKRVDLMIKFRCLQRWRRNVRLIKFLKLKYKLKQQRAGIYRRMTLIRKNFQAWHLLVKNQNMAACQLNTYHTLAKGIKALKWHVYNCQTGDEITKLTQERNFSTIKTVFEVWLHRVSGRRHNYLCKSFQRWKKHLYHIQLFKMFRTNREIKLMTKVYGLWKKVLYQQQILNAAEYFHSLATKKKIIKAWIIFFVNCNVCRTQSHIAQKKFEIHMMAIMFQRWKLMKKSMIEANFHFRKLLCLKMVKRWKAAHALFKVQHLKNQSAAFELRRRHLLRNTLLWWNMEVLSINFKRQQLQQKYRACFILMLAKFENLKKLNNLADLSHKNMLLKTVFGQWRTFCIITNKRRYNAHCHMKRCVVIGLFCKWKFFIMRRRSCEVLTAFVIHRKKDSMKSLFLLWKSLYFRSVLQREKQKQWSVKCTREAFRQWQNFTKRKKICLICENIIAHKLMLILFRCFIKWKNSYKKIISNETIAGNHYQKSTQQRLGRIVLEWQIATQESFVIRPLIKNKQRKQKTKVFDAWRKVVLRKHHDKSSRKLVQTNTIKICFYKWKWEHEKTDRLSSAISTRHDIAKYITFNALKKYTNRQSELPKFQQVKGKKVLSFAFHKWAILNTQRQLRAEEIHQREIRNQLLLKKHFSRWKQETLCEKILRQDSLSWFHKSWQLQKMQSKFKNWKSALTNHRLANEFANFQTKHKLLLMFTEWHNYAQCNLRAQEKRFRNSLQSHRDSFHLEDFNGSTGMHTSYNDLVYETSVPATINPVNIAQNLPNQERIDRNNIEKSDGWHSLLDHFASQTQNASELSDHKLKESQNTSTPKPINHMTPDNGADKDNFDVLQDRIPSSFSLPSNTDVNAIPYNSKEVYHIEHSVTTRSESCSSAEENSGNMTTNDTLDISHGVYLSPAEQSTSAFTLCDLVTRIPLTTDLDNSMNSADFITQRYIFADRTVQASSIRDTSGNSGCVRKPRTVIDGLIEGCTENPVKHLVHFAVQRLQRPLTSLVFCQWKLLVCMRKWQDSMLRHTQLLVNKLLLKRMYRTWQHSLASHLVSKNFYKHSAARQVFMSWLHWTIKNVESRRMKLNATVVCQFHLLERHFLVWKERSEEKLAFTEALNALEQMSKDHHQLESACVLLEGKRNSATVSRCMFLWKMQWKQIQLSDEHHKTKMLRIILTSWSEHVEKKRDARSTPNNIYFKNLKKRILIIWRRQLFLSDKVHQMRASSLRMTLHEQLIHWRSWSSKRKEVQRNKLHVMIFHSKSMDKKLNEKFKIWRNRFISHRRANANWQKTKQRKIIIWWKYCVNSNLILAAKKAIVERKMRKRMVVNAFHIWRRQYSLSMIESKVKIEVLRCWMQKWKKLLITRRMQRAQEITTLRFYFMSWMNEHNKCKRNKKFALEVFRKWHFITKKNSILTEIAQSFEQSRNKIKIKCCLISWSRQFEQSRLSNEHFQMKIFQKTFLCWVLYVRQIAAVRQDVKELSSNLKRRKFLRTWRRSLAVKKKVEAFKSTTASSSTKQLLIKWHQYSRDAVGQKKAVTHLKSSRDKYILQKIFTTWCRNLAEKFLAKDAHRRNLLGNFLHRWKSYLDRRRSTAQLVYAYSEKNKTSATRVYFARWWNLTSLTMLGREIEKKKLKSIFDSWKSSLIVNGAKQKHRKLFLQRYYNLWKGILKRRKRNRYLVKNVISKWRSLILQNDCKNSLAFSFMTSRNSVVIQSYWVRWRQCFEFSLKSRNYAKSVKLKTAILRWSRFSKSERTRKIQIIEFRAQIQCTSLASAWCRWLRSLKVWRLRVANLHKIQLMTINNQKRVCWLLWIQSMRMTKANKFYEKTLQIKLFKRWRSSAVAKQTEGQMLLDHICLKNKLTVRSYFTKWKNLFNLNQIAKWHLMKAVQVHILQRWHCYAKRHREKLENHADLHVRCTNFQKQAILKRWKQSLQSLTYVKSTTESLFQKFRHKSLLNSWYLWKLSMAKHKAKRLRERILVLRFLQTWRDFVEKRKIKRTVFSFQYLNALRQGFKPWERRRSANRKLESEAFSYSDVITQFSVITEPSVDQLQYSYSNHKILTSAWICWRLRLRLQKDKTGTMRNVYGQSCFEAVHLV